MQSFRSTCIVSLVRWMEFDIKIIRATFVIFSSLKVSQPPIYGVHLLRYSHVNVGDDADTGMCQFGVTWSTCKEIIDPLSRLDDGVNRAYMTVQPTKRDQTCTDIQQTRVMPTKIDKQAVQVL